MTYTLFLLPRIDQMFYVFFFNWDMKIFLKLDVLAHVTKGLDIPVMG